MKKHFKLGLIAFFGFVISAGLFAEDLTMDSVCKKLAEHPNTTGDFVQTKLIKSVNRSLKSNGVYIFSLEGIMWKTLKPFPSTLAVGETFVIQTAANGTKTVIDASDNQIFTSIAQTLSAVFSNDAEKLSSNFKTDFSDKGSGNWELILTPKDSTVASVLKSLTLIGSNSNSICSIDEIVMTEASDNSITYTFTNQKYPKELSADEKANFVSK